MRCSSPDTSKRKGAFPGESFMVNAFPAEVEEGGMGELKQEGRRQEVV
jgi:hypothetical protein